MLEFLFASDHAKETGNPLYSPWGSNNDMTTARVRSKHEVRERCHIVGVIATDSDLEMALTMPNRRTFSSFAWITLPIRDEVERQIPGSAGPSDRNRAPPGARAGPIIFRPVAGGNCSRAFCLMPVMWMLNCVPPNLSIRFCFPARSNVERILSLHDFDSTPTPRSLHAKARKAKSLGAAIFKVATRTETPAQLARLLEFISEDEVGIAVAPWAWEIWERFHASFLPAAAPSWPTPHSAEAKVEGQMSVADLRDRFSPFRFGS